MSPSMNTDSALDLKIKGNMIADLLSMVGVTPLADRYLDGNHLRHDIKNYKKPDNKQVELGLVEKFILKEVAAENSRCGGWTRVFPSASRRYKQFFEVDRYFNRLLRDHEHPQEIANNYRSVPNPKDRVSLTKKETVKIVNPPSHQGYNSLNEKRRGNSR
jgi:hypothetical protein